MFVEYLSLIYEHEILLAHFRLNPTPDCNILFIGVSLCDATNIVIAYYIYKMKLEPII